MNNKGFTIIEVMAVVVILGILASIAAISVTKYRQDVDDNELVNLHSTIEAAYDDYRADIIMNGGTPKTTINFSNAEDYEIIKKYFDDLTYSGSYLKVEDLEGSALELRVKGDLLEKQSYLDAGRDHVKDGTCLIRSEIEVLENGEKKIINSCDIDSGGEQPSQEEILCIVLKKGSRVLINDYDKDKTQRELCTYFNEVESE